MNELTEKYLHLGFSILIKGNDDLYSVVLLNNLNIPILTETGISISDALDNLESALVLI